MDLFSIFRRRAKEDVDVPVAKPPKRPGVAFVPYSAALPGVGRLEFEPSPIDLAEIDKAYNVDSYVSRAVDKYVELIFKSKWDIVGRNDKAVDYIKKRLAVMSTVMGQPIEMLFREMAEDLVKYANYFAVKVRGDTRYLLGLKATPVFGNKQPVVGYVCISPLTVQIARDKSGVVRAYRQVVPEVSSEPVEFKPTDVIHGYYRREPGRAFGTPFIWPVLEDVKLLRQTEELVAKLIYKELFPFVHWKVGLDRPGQEGQDEEVDRVRGEIAQMAEDGIFVTTERHSIEVLGVQGEALDAERYLRYFEQRVFTGLGVSESQMGRAATASRSAAENQTDQIYDTVKAFQSVIEVFTDFYMINELLLEGGFNPILEPRDRVHLKFREIDIDSLMKRENSAIFKFEHNATTFEEMREELNRETVVDESRLHYHMFPKGGGSRAETDNRQQPENQYGKKPAATRARNAVADSPDSSEVSEKSCAL